MGYIGNQQTEGFSSIPAKQDLTGATGTSLTLTHAVASAEGIDLFINNVRQESGEAYSIGGDGVTVTLTGSVVATDDIYVVYNSLALQTTVPPDASVSTAKIIDGSVTKAKIGTTELDLATIKDSTGTNTAMTIASSGAIAIPNQDAINELTFTGTDYTNIYSETTSGMDIGTTGSGYFRFLTNNAEAMRLTSTGHLGINNTGPSFPLVVSGKAANHVSAFAVATNGYAGALWYNASNSVVGQVQINASSTAYITSSDYRLKENVVADWDATTRLNQLNPVRFNFSADADTTVDGFLAHEVQDVVPEAITGTHNEVDDDGNPVYQGIDQSKLVPLLVKTIQELEARITALEAS